MRTRRSPRNQEILWRRLGDKKPSSPKKLSTSRLKPIFDWKQNRFVDPTGDATYLDHLGASSAAEYATVIRKQAGDSDIALPLPDSDVEILLLNTINGLKSQKKLDWERTNAEKRQVFITAWAAEMTRLGIRA